MRQPLPKIPDLEILEEIGHGGYSRLYRARRDGKDYVVKVLKEDRELDLASRFLREGTALARFSHPGLVSILEVGKDDGRPYLVMEYVDGETLAAHLSRGRVSEDMLRAWAKALASALSEVHRLGLVHRDIKPENILIDRSLSPKLIDFGFVAEATRTDADEVVGSFRYSAPEQTGMLKRAVDGRSDLYSLGVVLFECATGAPPFASENVGELLRQHAAIQAPTVISQRPDFSRAFSAVIAKLLAKDPDDRYRSAASLLHDLDNLHGLDLAKLDSHEVSSSAVEPSLVGREDELGRLVDYQARARNGQGVAVCISGEAGLGKTRLANELVKGVADERVFVLRGKCSQKNPVPFAPLRRAVEELLLTVSRLPETERAARLDVLRRAAGDGAGLLRHLAPGLFSLFADARETVPIDGEESQFHGAVADFILRLAGDGRSVILLVDDVQWVDGATLRILKNIRRRLAGGSFLMLVTARTDAESGFSLATINEELTISPETQVKLKALGESAVARMIVELLGGHEIESSFASQIAFRCKGNPFAVGEYLRALLDEGYLRYSWGRWILDAHQLGLIQLPGDVIHLVVKRVNGLDAETSKILCAAAVQGMRLQPKLLPEIAGATSAGVGFAIGEGYRAGLVTSENDGYAFVHERIRDAFAARLSPAELAELHQTIAEVTDHAGASGEEALYSLADHYAKGTPDKNPRRVYEVNLEAGTRAAGHYANQEAFDFLVQAYKASLRCAVPSSPMLFSALGDLCFRLDHVDTGISFLTRALDLTSDGGERAAIHTKLATGHLSRLDIRKAREAVFAGLADLGARYPRTIVGRLLSLGVWIVKACFARRVSAEGRPRLEALLALYTAGQLAAFHEFDSLTFVELILRSFYPARRLGRSPQLASCYAYFGMLLSFAKMKSFGRRYLDRSAAMAESLGDPRVLAEARLLGAYGVDGEGDPAKALPLLRDALKNHGRWLSHHHYMEASFAGIVGLMARGYVNEAWGWLEGVLQKVEENFIPDRMGLLLYPAYRAAMLARLGRMTQATECMNEARAMAKALPDNRFSWAFYLTQFLIYLTEVGDGGGEIDEIERLFREKVHVGPRSPMLHIRHYYLYLAYARLGAAWRAEGDARQDAVAKLRRAVAAIRPAREFPLFRGHVAVLDAAVAELAGRASVVRRRLAAAEEVAREFDHPWVTFGAAYLRARLLKAEGKGESALREASHAHASARNHGWNNFARKIRSEFPLDRPNEYSIGQTRSTFTASLGSTDAGGMRLKRQLDALLQVSLASASVLDPVALTRIALDEVIRILGAERGFLFLRNEAGGLVIQGGRDQLGRDIQELSGFSSTVVENTASDRKPIVVTGTESGPILQSESIITHNLRSIVAVPLLLKDKFLGVVYLDNRLAKGVFTDEDVEVLVAIASHIAVAFETSRVAQLEMERGKIKTAFQHYLSPDVVDQLLKDDKALSLRSERKELTVLFSDVRNFTGISEKLLPEQLSDLMNAYFTPMTSLILESRGVLDKYIGDAVMAFWGAPIRLDNHADLAAEVALKMLGELARLQLTLEKRGYPKIDIGIGLNTGIMSVGNMGCSHRFNYTVMGDSVNLGSRLEGLTKVYGVKIILSEYTKDRLTRTDFVTRELDEVRVRGKNTPLRIFELISPEFGPSLKDMKEFTEEFAAGRADYLARNWQGAKAHFSRCLRIRPTDVPAKLYLARLQALKNQPPGGGWDGVAISMRG